jgi:group I intron endonuclease
MTTKNQNNTKIPGIYEIINLVNNKKYIGQSVDIRTRLNNHKSSLKNNKHHNRHLQAAYNKYGADNFRFNILESDVSINSLDTLERYYIYIFKATNIECGYNIENGGHEGKKLSEEHKRKISTANRRLSDLERLINIEKRKDKAILKNKRYDAFNWDAMFKDCSIEVLNDATIIKDDYENGIISLFDAMDLFKALNITIQ